MPDAILDVLTWVFLVLAAAFIGQFGKALAKTLMAKVQARRDRARRGASGEETAQGPPTQEAVADLLPAHDERADPKVRKVAAKAAKKAAKAEIKQTKKLGKKQ